MIVLNVGVPSAALLDRLVPRRIKNTAYKPIRFRSAAGFVSKTMKVHNPVLEPPHIVVRESISPSASSKNSVTGTWPPNPNRLVWINVGASGPRYSDSGRCRAAGCAVHISPEWVCRVYLPGVIGHL